MPDTSVVIAIVTLLINILVLIIGLARNNTSARREIDVQITKETRELREIIEAGARNMGEAVSAVRTKINQVELWTRDEFVRREDFYRIVDGMNKAIGDLGDKIDARTDQLLQKIDEVRR